MTILEELTRLGREITSRSACLGILTPFAAELVAWRKRNNLTQTQAATRLGKSPDVYRAWEHGRWKPKDMPTIQAAMAAAEQPQTTN